MSRICDVCGGKILCPDVDNSHLCSECGQDIVALRVWEKLSDESIYDDDIEALMAKEDCGDDI